MAPLDLVIDFWTVAFRMVFAWLITKILAKPSSIVMATTWPVSASSMI